MQTGTRPRDSGKEFSGAAEPFLRGHAARFHVKRKHDPDFLQRYLPRHGRKQRHIRPGPGAEQDLPDGVQIAGTRIVIVGMAEHFRRDEACGPGRRGRAVQQVGKQTVVGQFRFAVDEEDIVRLDVAVGEPGLVQVPDRRQNPFRELQRLIRRKPSLFSEAVCEGVRLVIRPLSQVVRRRHDAIDASVVQLPRFQDGHQPGNVRGHRAAFFDSGEFPLIVRFLNHLQDQFPVDLLVNQVQVAMTAPDNGGDHGQAVKTVAFMKIERKKETHSGMSVVNSGFSVRISDTIRLSAFRHREQ